MKRLLPAAAMAGFALLAAPTAAYAYAGPVTASRVATVETWKQIQSPLLLPSATAEAIAAQSADSVWFGGRQGYFCVTVGTSCLVQSKGSPVVRQWNGSGWKQYSLTGAQSVHGIDTIAADPSDANGVWVLSDSWTSDRYLARFDGSAFVPVAKPAGHEVSVVRTGPAGTWIIGYSLSGQTLFRRTGTTWTETPVPAAMHQIADIQALSATDAWAVGGAWDSAGSPTPALAHWDGTSWQAVPAPRTDPQGGALRFVHVTPVAANDVWVTTMTSLEHWNGDVWQHVPMPAGAYSLKDTVVDKDGVLWVAVYSQSMSRSYVYRYGPSGWERSGQEFVDVAGDAGARLSVVPDGDTVWAAGNDGMSPDVTSVPAGPHIAVLQR